MSLSNGLSTIYCDHRVGYALDIQLMSSDLNSHVGADGKHFFFFPFLILNTVLHSSFDPFLLEQGQTKPSDSPFCAGLGPESSTE